MPLLGAIDCSKSLTGKGMKREDDFLFSHNLNGSKNYSKVAFASAAVCRLWTKVGLVHSSFLTHFEPTVIVEPNSISAGSCLVSSHRVNLFSPLCFYLLQSF